MFLKLGLLFVTAALVVIGWTYARTVATVMPVRPAHQQLACAGDDCIVTITPCRSDPVSGWNDSLYAAGKAPGVELRPCRRTTELARRD